MHYKNRHKSKSDYGEDMRGHRTELRFVSFDQGRKSLVENRVYISNLDRNARYGDYLLAPLWDKGEKPEGRTRFAVLRQQREVKHKRKLSHGLLGLWG